MKYREKLGVFLFVRCGASAIPGVLPVNDDAIEVVRAQKLDGVGSKGVDVVLTGHYGAGQQQTSNTVMNVYDWRMKSICGHSSLASGTGNTFIFIF